MQPHPEGRKQLVEIERRSWHLWIISLTIIAGLSFGITLLLFPVLQGYAVHLEAEHKGLPQLVIGLAVLVTLSGIYVVMKQRELNALRNFIIASYIAATASKDQYPHDALTGALDRSALPDLLTNERGRADRVGEPFCVVILDVKNFRRINESQGNLVGDLILKELALLLGRTARQNDWVLRYGPDEFLCLLGGSRIEGGEVFLRRVEKGFGHIARLRGITLIAGFSEYRTGTNAEAVVADAERSLQRKSQATLPATTPPSST
jgi:GGDEF domain-containing protein